MEKILPSLISELAARREPLTVKEFAAVMRVSIKSVYNAIDTAAFPVTRFMGSIRIDPGHAAKWLRARQVR